MQHKLPQHLAIENLILSHHSLIKISLTHSPTLFLSLSICPHNPRFPCSLSPHLCLSLPTDSLSLLVLPQSHLSQSLTRSTKKNPPSPPCVLPHAKQRRVSSYLLLSLNRVSFFYPGSSFSLAMRSPTSIFPSSLVGLSLWCKKHQAPLPLCS
jgi:hypothetical protein